MGERKREGVEIKTIINKLSDGIAIEIEQYLKLNIQPKPKWLPNFLWRKLLKRLLILEVYQ